MSLARLPLLRLVQSKATWLAIAGWSVVALASAWSQQHHAATHGADHALDFYASIVVPLLVYALVAVGLGHTSLALSGRSLVRLGASPARVAWATVLVTVLASALVCGLLGAAVAGVAHGSQDPPRVEDSVHVLAFGALAGAAYAAYFLVGGAFVAGLWGRALLLVVDWILGAGVGAFALLTPRAHLRNLLGGEPPFEAEPWESLAALAVIVVLCGVLATRRGARTRT
jgi:hypothetical protein